MKKQIYKSLLSIILTLIMVTNIAVIAFAQEENTAIEIIEEEQQEKKTSDEEEILNPGEVLESTKEIDEPDISDDSGNVSETKDSLVNQTKSVPEESVSRARVSKKYQIVIHYLDASTREKIALSAYSVLDEGQNWNVTSPEIEGYKLKDATKKELSGVASGSSTTIALEVLYQRQDTNYTIICTWINTYGIEQELKRETKTGIAGTVVTVAAPAIAGYKCVTDDKTVIVSEDGKAVKYLKYEEVEQTFTIYFYTQGSYVPYISGKAGDAVVTPVMPTRLGYDFDGWDQTVPATVPNHNMYINAKWTAALVNYTVEYYRQDNSDANKYHLVTTKTLSGYTESMTPSAPAATAAEISPIKGYEYKEDISVEIKADGTSIHRVYYDLVDIEIRCEIEISDGNTILMEEFTAPFSSDQPLPANVMEAYKNAGGQATGFVGWKNMYNASFSTSIGLTEEKVDLDTKKVTYLAVFSDLEYHSYYVRYFKRGLDGTFDTNPSTSYNYSYTMTSIGNKDGGAYGFRPAKLKMGYYDGGDEGDIVWNSEEDIPYTPDGTYPPYVLTPRISLNGTNNIAHYYFERLSYPVYYYSNGVLHETKEYLYEETYYTSEVDTSTLTPPSAEHVFAGWYVDTTYTGMAVEQGTIPYKATNYYAKWELSKYKATFDVNGATSGAVDDQEVERYGTVIKPADPTCEGRNFIGWFYKDDSVHYTRYEFDKPVETDINLIALWEENGAGVPYVVVHQKIDGTVLKTEIFSGMETETVTVGALAKDVAERQGLAYSDALYKSIQLSPQPEKNIITFYYSDDVINKYTIHYLEKGTNKVLAPAEEIVVEDWLIDVKAKEIKGYTVETKEAQVTKEEKEYTFYYVKEGTPISKKTTSQKVTQKVTTSKDAKTGDYTSLFSVFAVAVLSAGTIFMLSKRRRRNWN